MSYIDEFKTIELLKNSNAVTKGVDSFALSLIKAERQIRKLMTYLIFQYPCFSEKNVMELRSVLEQNRKVYFEGFENGFNKIYSKSIQDLVGAEYNTLRQKIVESIRYRNKIFHGQLTDKNLSQDELFSYVDSISKWCKLLADASNNNLGYDSFARNSFQKSTNNLNTDEFKMQIKCIDEYRNFLKDHVQRKS